MDSNKIQIKINTKFITALIDSGARLSVLRATLLPRLKLHPSALGHDDPTFLVGANGSRIPVLGKILLPVKLQGLLVPFEFLVAETLTHELLLGHDFLTETKALINYADSSITFYDNMVELKLINNTRNIIALVESDCELKPESESLIPVRLTQNISGTDLLLEALPMRENQRFLVAKSLAPIVHGQTFCQVMNPTNQIIYLRNNLPIAFISQIDVSSLPPTNPTATRNHSYVNTLDTPLRNHFQTKNSTNQFQRTFPSRTNGHQQTSPPTPSYTQGTHRTLQELGITITNTNLSESEKNTLSKLIEQNSDIFAISLHDLPGTPLHTYDIDTGDSKPIRQRPYRPSPSGRVEMSKQIKELLDAGFIEPSTGPWGSPCILVKKKTGDQRFVIDYRRLNQISIPLSWPLPLLTDVIDTLANNKCAYFTSLDMKSGYHQIPMSHDASIKSAFVTPEGTFAWKRLAFGLQGAGQAFSMLMSHVLRGLTFQKLIVYVDDILIFSPTFEQHCKDLNDVFSRLRHANLRLHPRKCSFAQSETLYLGHTINNQGIQVDHSKIFIVKNWAIPTTVKEVRRFLGFFEFYRRFCHSYAKICTL